MDDIYVKPMLNTAEAATFLAIPASTLGVWQRNQSIHSVAPERRGWPTLPFAAVVEAFVLRALRELRFCQRKIREAALGIRREFDDEFGLVRPNIGTDGVEIFLEVGKDLYRAKDGHQIIRETVSRFEKFIDWEGRDPSRLRLQQFDGAVILDPRFGWGTPVIASNKVPLHAVLGLWRAGESIADIAVNFRMEPAAVERVIQSYDRSLFLSEAVPA
jgi:uncharacterized protein (DUF433 family)